MMMGFMWLLTDKTRTASLNPYLAPLQISSGKKWFKKVHQDWGILQNNLPGKIPLLFFMINLCPVLVIVGYNGVI